MRKSYATTERPLQLRLASNEGPVRCNATVVDTMMLSPAGTSLEKLGKLIGVPKVELPDGYSKDRMDLFLRDHPEWFEQYAITDAIIPAMWVAQNLQSAVRQARHQEEGDHARRRGNRTGEAGSEGDAASI